MNPSYVRLRQSKDVIMPHFIAWIKLGLISHHAEIRISDSISLSIDDEENWIGASFLVFENEFWTVIQDMTGYLATKKPEDWEKLSKGTELIFTGYNDAIPYGQFIGIENELIYRDFLHDMQDQSENRNIGESKYEEVRFETWDDVAAFIDDDEIGIEPDIVDVYIFEYQE
jgi:hypothetical protein